MQMLTYRWFVVMGVLVLGLIASGAVVSAQEDPAQQYAGQTPAATVNLDEVQIGYLVMGTLGGGTLHYQGNDYRFKIGGLGAGGAGVDKLKASGEVYGLKNTADFAGEYVDARIGIAATVKGKGDLWLKNDKGVHMHLKSQLEGLALTLGADALTVKMDK
jgi:hypothetical protein